MKQNSSIFRIIFILFVSIIIIFGSLYILNVHSENNTENIETSENFHLQLLGNSLRQELNGVIEDLTLISKDHTLLTYLENNNQLNYKNLCNEFLDYASQTKTFNQIRFIDTTGKETVRINYNKNKSYIVSKNKLQNKHNRYYFRNTIKLNNNEVYISKFDLNIEHGKIEKPYKPTIRFCSPVFNSKGNKKGIVVLNFLGNTLLNQISEKKHTDMLGDVMLVNQDGYFLRKENKNDKVFGFMFKPTAGQKFSDKYPDEWDLVNKSTGGKILTKNGLFTFLTISPSKLNNSNVPRWKIISHVTRQRLAAQTKKYNEVVIGIDISLFAFMFIGLFFYLHFDKQKIQQQKKLKESESRFKSIFYNSGVGIAQISLDGYIVTVNTKFAEITGYSIAELLKMKNSNLIYSEDFEKTHEDMKLLQSGKSDSIIQEKRLVKKDGNIIWINLSITSLLNAENMLIGLIGIVSDITEIKKSRKNLEQSEVKFRTIVDNAGDAMFISDLAGNIMEVNTQACLSLGYQKNELIGMNVSALDPVFVKNDHLNTIWKNFELNKPITFEAVHKRKNGSIFPVEIRTGLIEIDGVRYVLGFARNITERKNAEKKLQQYFITLDETQKFAKLGFYERNVNTNEGFWSDGLYRIFGFEPGEVPAFQESFLKIVHPDDLSLVKEGIEESLKNHKPSDIVHRIYHKNGEIRFMRAICQFVYDENDAPLLHRGIFIDITEQEKQKSVEKVLSEISEEAIFTDDIFSFIEKVHTQINTLIDAPNLSVALYHEEEDEYSFPYFVNEKGKDNRLPRMKIKGGRNDYVRRTKKPLFADKENFESLMKKGEIGLIGEDSSVWLGAPLLTSSGVIGVLAIQHYNNPNAYTQNDLEMLNLIANNVARVIERKQLLDQIKQSEKHFRQLFDLSPAGILIENSKGIIIDVNETYCKISGFSKTELVGKHVSFVSHNANIKEVNHNISRILSGEILEKEVNCFNKDGSYRITKLLETRIVLQDQKYGVLSVANDITELKNTEKVLLESEEKYRNLTEASIFGIVIHTNGIVKYANKAAKNIMEYNAIDEMYEQNVMNFIHPDFRELVRKRIKETSERSKVSKAVEEKFITDKGNIINVEVVSIPIIYNGEKSSQVIFYDITERKKVREELIEKEDYIRSVFCNIHENIFIMNSDYEIIDVNRKVLLDTDYTKEEVIGKHCYEISHQNDKPCNLCGEDCYLEKIFETGSPFNYRHVHISKNGKEKHIDIMMSPLRDKDGKVIKVIEAMRDITDVFEAERKTQKSEAKFRQLFENNLAGVFETNIEGEIITCNHRFAEIYGYNKEEDLIGKNAVILYHKSDDRKNFIKKLKNKKTLLAKEYEMKKKNGDSVWVLENSAVLNSGNIYGTEIDITERINAINELEESERKFKQLTELSPFGIIVHNNGKLKYANKAAKLIFESDISESFEGRDIFDFVHPDFRKDAKKRTETVINLNEIQKATEMKYITLKGRVIDVEATAIPLDTGVKGTVQVIFTDVTERKRLQSQVEEYQKNLERKVTERTKELTESEDKYRVLAETSDAFIVRMDKNGKLLYVNNALLTASGKKESDIFGKNHSEIVGKKKSELATKKLEPLLRKTLSENSTQRMEMQVPWGGWVEWHFSPESKGTNKPENVVIIGYDITQKKEAQLKLRTALNREKELNKLKTQFISTVSHEFRTPLTAIFSSIDLLELFGDKWTEEKKNAQFEQMRGSVNRLSHMLDEVLQISRIDRDKLNVNFENVNLQKTIEDILIETKPLLSPKHKIVKNLNIEQKNYLVDIEIIRTVLLNLLSNAIKYSPDGGNIELKINENKNNLIFIVADQGVGIAEKDLKNIFSEFYRASETAHIQGTGLGLSIVKNLLDKLNGIIKVESELGKGTKFTVTMPVKH